MLRKGRDDANRKELPEVKTSYERATTMYISPIKFQWQVKSVMLEVVSVLPSGN